MSSRGRLRFSIGLALNGADQMARDPVAETRAWKLFGLVPMMLLRRPRQGGFVGRYELAQRADDFARGLWCDLLADARQSQYQGSSKQESGNEQERRGAAASSRVQVSRARHELTGRRRDGHKSGKVFSHRRCWISTPCNWTLSCSPGASRRRLLGVLQGREVAQTKCFVCASTTRRRWSF